MLEMVRFGLRELKVRWRTTIGMIAGVGLALLVLLALEGITRGAAAAFAPPEQANWIVQQKGSLGEFSGSRLPGSYAAELRTLGAEAVVPEIHTVTGTSFDDAMLVRGVPLESYLEVERFTLTSGEALASGDRGLAMVGESLAEARSLAVGDTLKVLDSEFRIKGIFRVGTLADSEAWLPLKKAQSLFGFDDNVSIYVARGEESLKEKIEAALEVEVTREGEGFASFSQSMASFVRVLRVASTVMALAAALGILNVMFTMVQARRREMAVLRAVGFGRKALVLYVLAQAAAISLLGFLVALLAALGLMRGLDFAVFGISIRPLLDARTAGLALLWSLAIGLAAGAYPALLAANFNLAETLRAE